MKARCLSFYFSIPCGSDILICIWSDRFRRDWRCCSFQCSGFKLRSLTWDKRVIIIIIISIIRPLPKLQKELSSVRLSNRWRQFIFSLFQTYRTLNLLRRLILGDRSSYSSAITDVSENSPFSPQPHAPASSICQFCCTHQTNNIAYWIAAEFQWYLRWWSRWLDLICGWSSHYRSRKCDRVFVFFVKRRNEEVGSVELNLWNPQRGNIIDICHLFYACLASIFYFQFSFLFWWRNIGLSISSSNSVRLVSLTSRWHPTDIPVDNNSRKNKFNKT